MGNDYYDNLVDPTRINSARSIKREHDRVAAVEEGRMAAQVNSPLFGQLLQQNRYLSEEIELLKRSEEKSKREAHRAQIAFWVSTSLAIIAIVIALLAWLLPR